MTTNTPDLDYILSRCPGCRTDQKLYIHNSTEGYWLACPSCEWTQTGCHADADAAVQAYDDIPPTGAPPTPDYLDMARSRAKWDSYNATTAYAAVAQAEAAQRMAAAAEQQAAELRMVREVLETLLDAMAAEVQP